MPLGPGKCFIAVMCACLLNFVLAVFDEDARLPHLFDGGSCALRRNGARSGQPHMRFKSFRDGVQRRLEHADVERQSDDQDATHAELAQPLGEPRAVERGSWSRSSNSPLLTMIARSGRRRSGWNCAPALS